MCRHPAIVNSPARSSLWLLTWLVLSTASVGCGEPNARGLNVNASTARDSLKTFLMAWKDGRKSSDLAPKIIGKDSDWESNEVLEAFEVLPEQRSDGANLFLKVRRRMKTSVGTELDQEVNYVVSTSPVITVHRADQ